MNFKQSEFGYFNCLPVKPVRLVAADYEHEWTETLGLGLNPNYVDVSHDGNLLDLTAYTSTTVGPKLTFRISERSAWSMSINLHDSDSRFTAELENRFYWCLPA